MRSNYEKKIVWESVSSRNWELIFSLETWEKNHHCSIFFMNSQQKWEKNLQKLVKAFKIIWKNGGSLIYYHVSKQFFAGKNEFTHHSISQREYFDKNQIKCICELNVLQVVTAYNFSNNWCFIQFK